MSAVQGCSSSATSRFNLLAAAAVFPPDRLPDPAAVEASTLLDPVIVEAARSGWAGY